MSVLIRFYFRRTTFYFTLLKQKRFYNENIIVNLNMRQLFSGREVSFS